VNFGNSLLCCGSVTVGLFRVWDVDGLIVNVCTGAAFQNCLDARWGSGGFTGPCVQRHSQGGLVCFSWRALSPGGDFEGGE